MGKYNTKRTERRVYEHQHKANGCYDRAGRDVLPCRNGNSPCCSARTDDEPRNRIDGGLGDTCRDDYIGAEPALFSGTYYSTVRSRAVPLLLHRRIRLWLQSRTCCIRMASDGTGVLYNAVTRIAIRMGAAQPSGDAFLCRRHNRGPSPRGIHAETFRSDARACPRRYRVWLRCPHP